MKRIITRWQESSLHNALEVRRVVLLVGPRQCGKTTLAKTIMSKGIEYLTLDDASIRTIAENDPKGFVQKRRANTMIIDEIQRVPSLLPAIKQAVDENTSPGQYILTGSANIQALPSTQDSLAGRVSKVRLRTFSRGELSGSKPDFLSHAFEQNFSLEYHSYSKDEVLKMAFEGGFPEAISLSANQRKLWHRDYIEALLERDLRDVAKIQRYDAMRDLIKVVAAWSSKFMDISAISSQLSVKNPTVLTYLNALESLYVIEKLYPWTKTDYARVGKQNKLFMSDSGLMASILSWNLEQVRLDPDKLGKLMETFIFNEIASQVDTQKGLYEMYHYRDREQREIDFIIEREDHALLGIEVKASSSIQSKDFKHLSWFQENIAKDTPFVGIVIYTGEQPLLFGKNLWAIPVGMLWPELKK